MSGDSEQDGNVILTKSKELESMFSRDDLVAMVRLYRSTLHAIMQSRLSVGGPRLRQMAHEGLTHGNVRRRAEFSRIDRQIEKFASEHPMFILENKDSAILRKLLEKKTR